MNNAKISINDIEIECEVLYTFKSDHTNKNYVICSDKKVENNSLKLYAFIYYPDNIEKGFEKIENEEDWNEVEKTIPLLEESL